MTWLILGLIVLIGIHLVPAAPAVRQQMVEKMGPWPYTAVFSLISLIGLGLIVWGKAMAQIIPLWGPPAWGYYVPPLLMIPAFVLLAGAYLPGNTKRFIRNPMATAVVLWAVGHLFANGDAASLILFGGLGAYSAFSIWSANRRGAQKQADTVHYGWDVLVVVVGLALYAALVMLHPTLFGVPAMAPR